MLEHLTPSEITKSKDYIRNGPFASCPPEDFERHLLDTVMEEGISEERHSENVDQWRHQFERHIDCAHSSCFSVLYDKVVYSSKEF